MSECCACELVTVSIVQSLAFFSVSASPAVGNGIIIMHMQWVLCSFPPP